jgi:hypothetical protein
MVFMVMKCYCLCYEFDVKTWDIPNIKETLPKFQQNLNELVKWKSLDRFSRSIE